MELELVAGRPQALFSLARDLQGRAALTLSFESKAERGYRLAGHDGVAALKAQRTAIGPETTGAAAFQAVSRDALMQIAGNAGLLLRAHNPDVLHQMRVGLRRFRAGLSTFKGLVDPEGLNLARRETKWLANELSEARDIDVFLMNAAATDDIEESPGRAAFFRALRISQAEAYERALAAVRSDRFRTLLLTLGEWIEAGAWLRLANDEQRLLREGPAVALAAPILDQDRPPGAPPLAQVPGAGGHRAPRPAQAGQEAALRRRLLCRGIPKHPKRRERYGTLLRILQERLGELNDMAVARAVAMRAVGRRSGELAFAAGLEVGRLTGDEDAALKVANKALKAFRRSEPFWSHPAPRTDDLNLSRPRLRSV
jgi:CHAD domain-containing protein